MDKLKSFIEDMYKKGVTPEEIAKEVTIALNSLDDKAKAEKEANESIQKGCDLIAAGIRVLYGDEAADTIERSVTPAMFKDVIEMAISFANKMDEVESDPTEAMSVIKNFLSVL